MTTCTGCNEPLPPNKAPGPPRKWCSERCRRRTMYTTPCKTCGAAVYDGSAKPPDECGDCKYRRTYRERNERIFKAWNEGEPAWYIGEREGMTETQVGSLINHHRGLGRNLVLHRKRNRQDWGRVKALYDQGATYREIAEKLGTTRENVNQLVQSMRAKGYDLPHRRPVAA